MSFVRPLVDGESNDGSEQSNNEQVVRVLSTEAEREMLVIGQFERFIKPLLKDMIREPLLKDMIRELVKDGTELSAERLRTSMNWYSENGALTSKPRSLMLKFLSKISSVIFTGKKNIVSEESAPIEIALVDGLTGQVVKSGPEASAKVKIVVLEGDFGRDDWTLEEFDSKIAKEMQGGKSLLVRNELNLKEGIGLVSEVSFTHKSSWMKICQFRLGAKVVDHFNGIIVKEAKTEPFTVKDLRCKYNKKPDSPSLHDEVWKLKNIGKNGPIRKRLKEENVKTVKDFLIRLSIDPQELQQILKGGDKKWKDIVDHALKCEIDRKVYVYPSLSEPRTWVVLNVVGHMLGLLLESQYVPINKLSQIQKANAHKSVVIALKHWEDVVPFDDESALTHGSTLLFNGLNPLNSSSHLFNALNPSNSTMLEAPSGNHFMTCNMGTMSNLDRFDYPQLNASSPGMMPQIFSMGTMSNLDDYGLHGIDLVGVSFDHPSTFSDQVPNSLICDTDSVTQNFCADEHLQYFDTDRSHESPSLESQADLHTAVNNFLMARSAVAVKAQRRWRVLFRVLRWSSLMLRLVALEEIHVSKKRKCF